MGLKLIPPGKRHGSPHYYVRGTVRGIPVDETTGTENEAAAEAYRIKRENELLDRSILGERAPKSFVRAAHDYLEATKLSTRDQEYVIRLAEFFAGKSLSQIDQAAVESAVRRFSPKGSPATQNRTVIGPIAAILHHAGDVRKIARREPPKGRTEWLTYEQADRLIEAAWTQRKFRPRHTTIAPLVEFLFYTGCRIGEALRLEWRDVDLTRRHVLFRDTKNGDDRGIPLHARAFEAIANLPDRNGRVFRRPDGEPYEDREDDSGGQIKTAWIAACARAGFAKMVKTYKDKTGRTRKRWKAFYSPHTCRHTWASWFYAETRDVRALMELGGWKELSQVQRYTHVNKEHLRSAVDRLGGSAGTASGEQEEKKGVSNG